MGRMKSSEMSPIQRRGRNSKKRGYTTEKQLEKFLLSNGIPAERVMLSGALKETNYDGLRGDVNIKLGDKLVRVEVKSRQKLPAYVVGMRHGKPWVVKEIEHLCYLLTEEEFLTMCIDGSLPLHTPRISSARCKQLENWFKQDDADIVAMKEYGKKHFYFAVKHKIVNKMRGRYK